MPEENKDVATSEKVSIEKNYLDQIESLKKQVDSMVSVDEYNKLAAEHKEFVDKYIAGETTKKQETPEDSKKRITDYFKVATHANSDLEGITAMLDYADAFEEEYKYDPLVGQDPNNPPTQSEIDESKAMREYMRECIREANGDSAVFKTLLTSNIVGFKATPKK